MPVLVVDALVAALVGRAGRPRLSEDVPVGDLLIGMLLAPHLHDVRDVRDARAEDERQPGGLDGPLVAIRDHPRVRHDRDILKLVGFHERGDSRQHRGGLGLVTLESVDHQRKTGRVGEQADGDLRLQTAFLREPRLAEPVTSIDLKVESGHIVEHQARRSQPGLRRAPPQQATAARTVSRTRAGVASTSRTTVGQPPPPR